MKIQGTLTAQDYQEFLQMNLSVLRWGLASTFLFSLLWVALGATPFLFLLAACTIAFIFPLRLLSAAAPFLFSFRRKLQGLRHIEITAHGLILDSAAESLAGDWKQRFTGYRLGEKIIVVYQRGHHSQILAKRWFTDHQLTDFQAVLRTNLGQPKE